MQLHYLAAGTQTGGSHSLGLFISETLTFWGPRASASVSGGVRGWGGEDGDREGYAQTQKKREHWSIWEGDKRRSTETEQTGARVANCTWVWVRQQSKEATLMQRASLFGCLFSSSLFPHPPIRGTSGSKNYKRALAGHSYISHTFQHTHTHTHLNELHKRDPWESVHTAMRSCNGTLLF